MYLLASLPESYDVLVTALERADLKPCHPNGAKDEAKESKHYYDEGQSQL